MAVGRKFRSYREALAKLKLRQLDVYRFKDHDEIRVLTPDGRVVLIKLPKHREEMSIDEFTEHVRKAVEAARRGQ
jgi:hypothetical protein